MQGFDEEFDFVVVGSGGGSMCAALVMRTAGFSVVILEKTDLVGGTTARSGGVMWIPRNRFMRESGIEDSLEESVAYLEATAGQSADAPGTNPQRRATYAIEAPRMVDFLVEQGVKLHRNRYWPDYYDERAGGSKAGRTVSAELFDVNELGEWKKKLRPSFLAMAMSSDEGFAISTFKSSWRGKAVMVKVGLRTAVAKLTGKSLVTAGAALQGRMLQAALRAQVTIRTDAYVKEFAVHEGAVTGVVVESDGRSRRIGGRLGVLVNAGGFAQNREMRETYLPGTSVEWTGAGPGDTGEMIRQMVALGAGIGQMNERVGNQFSIPPGRENWDGQGLDISLCSGQMDIAKPHSIVVDRSGVRYMNEAGSYMTFCQNMLERNETVPSVPSWWIVDANYMRKYMFNGTMPGLNKPKEWYDSGYLKRADTVGELANLIGLDPKVLEQTVLNFNKAATTGHDGDFGRGARAYDEFLGDPWHRPSHTLGTVSEAPFYAAPVHPGDVGTYGGVVTDEYARVLRDDGAPIPGLYATGTSTASVMGRVYPGAGSSVGPSFVWGYVAAKHAAGINEDA